MDVAIIRLEQLYPLSRSELDAALAPYANGTPLFWVQEDPWNMGAWYFLSGPPARDVGGAVPAGLRGPRGERVACRRARAQATSSSSPGCSMRPCAKAPHRSSSMTSSDPSSLSNAGAARRGRLLVINDNALVRVSLGHILSLDHEVTLSGQSALKLFAEGARFDAILCDINMPGMRRPPALRGDGDGHAPISSKRTIFLTGGAYTARGRPSSPAFPTSGWRSPSSSRPSARCSRG